MKLLPLSLTMAALSLLLGCTANSLSSSAPDAPLDGSTAPVTEPSQTAAVATIFAENQIAIGGADPVAYFTQAAYVPGSADFTYEWQGVTWQFANAAHRDQFASNPEAYAPQYGGFCAWAVSQGYTAPIDPTAWKIVDGKLYLNYSQAIQQKWARDIPGNIAQANQNWPAVLER
jgi:YHS domain-containing protein